MILTDKQIEQIRSFCEDWGVTFYDVNTELVDHIASIIEREMAQNSKISFDQAFMNARKSFDPEGFDKLIKDRETQISKQGKKAQLKFFASFFRWPKLAMTFLFVVTSLALTYFFPSTAKFIALAMLIPSIFLVLVYPELFYGRADNYIRPTIPFSKDKFIQVQPLLIFNRKNNMTFLAQLGIILFNFSYLLFSNMESAYKDKIMSLFYFGLAGINFIGYLAFKEQRDRLLQYAIQNYPDAFQSKQY